MHLKVETEYAIRMVDYLTKSKRIAAAADISEGAKVPLRFAKNILQKLAKKEIVISHKGIKGGYELGKKIEEISLYDVVIAIDGPLTIFKGKKCFCTLDNVCPYHTVFKELSQDMENRLREIKFATIYC